MTHDPQYHALALSRLRDEDDLAPFAAQLAPRVADMIQQCIDDEIEDLRLHPLSWMPPDRERDADDGQSYGHPADEIAERSR